MLPVPQSLGVWVVTKLSNGANTKRLFNSILYTGFYIAYSSRLMLVEVGLVARPLGS